MEFQRLHHCDCNPREGFTRLTAAPGWRLQSELEEEGSSGRGNSRNQIAIAILRGGCQSSRWLPDPRSPQLAHFPNDPVEDPFAKTFYFT